MVAAAQPRLRCQSVPLGDAQLLEPGDGRLQVVQPARVAGLDPGEADRAQGVGLQLGQPQRPGHGQHLPADGQALGVRLATTRCIITPRRTAALVADGGAPATRARARSRWASRSSPRPWRKASSPRSISASAAATGAPAASRASRAAVSSSWPAISPRQRARPRRSRSWPRAGSPSGLSSSASAWKRAAVSQPPRAAARSPASRKAARARPARPGGSAPAARANPRAAR